MTARFCKCGCGASLADRRRGTVWATESCRSAFRAGEAPVQRGKRSPGGMQVPYARAVGALRAALRYRAGYSPQQAEVWAERLMRQELPARQRARLEARR